MRYLSFTNQEQKKNAFFSAYAIARTCLGKNESSSKQYRSDTWLDIKVWTKNCENWKQSLLSWLANISKISSVTNSDYLCINYINNYAFVKIVKKSSDHLFFLHLATAFSWIAQVVLDVFLIKGLFAPLYFSRDNRWGLTNTLKKCLYNNFKKMLMRCPNVKTDSPDIFYYWVSDVNCGKPFKASLSSY